MQKSSNIGGQAVMEGIMMRNGDKYALAVRKTDGDIELMTEDYKGFLERPGLMKVPIVRGVISFVDSLVVGIRCLMKSASFFEEEEEKEDLSALTEEERKKKEAKEKKQENIFLTGTLLLSFVIAIALFMALPYFLANLLRNLTQNEWVISLLESILRVVILLIYMLLVSKMEDIQRTFRYHGAEHKCINCVEHGLELNVENVMKSSRLHKRCGTSFLFYVVIISAIFLIFIQADSTAMRILIRVLLIPVIAGVSYEVIRLAGRNDNAFVNLLSKPGMALQKLTTSEPDESLAEVAIAAVEAVFDWRTYLNENFSTNYEKADLRKPGTIPEDVHPGR